MRTLQSFKMPFRNNAFNEGQRVWVIANSGNMAMRCAGKWRGKGRYVGYWVSYAAKDRIPPAIQEFEVDDSFADRMVAL